MRVGFLLSIFFRRELQLMKNMCQVRQSNLGPTHSRVDVVPLFPPGGVGGGR